jgi:putative phosphoesterase
MLWYGDGMKIGVLSDTHDNLANLRLAVGVFAGRGVGAVIHAGDFCSPFTLQEFSPLFSKGVRMHAVFGNNDGDRVHLVRRGADFCAFHDGAAVVELDGRRIVAVHYPDLAAALLASGVYDLVIHGHDHAVRVEGGPRRLLNPGTCSGYLASRATVAVVDTADLSIEVVDL